MTFKELREIFRVRFGVTKLADMARDLDISPQLLNSWKLKDQIPEKYIRILKNKKSDRENAANDKAPGFGDNPTIIMQYPEDSNSENYLSITTAIIQIITLIKENMKLMTFIFLLIVIFNFFKITFFTSPIYVSNARILPMGSNDYKSQLQGLAAQFGIMDKSGSESTNLLSKELLPQIVKSNLLLDKLLFKDFNYGNSGKNRKLISILLGFETDSMSFSYGQKRHALFILKKSINVYSPRNTSLISISTRTFDPLLSFHLADSLINQLDMFYKKVKRDKSKEKRVFVEARINELRKELGGAEEGLRVFKEKNRNINKSPSLLLEESRLSREVSVKNQIFANLSTEYELSKIEELSNNSMVAILDKPSLPLKRSSPNKTKSMIIAIVVAIFTSFLIAYIKDWLGKNWILFLKPIFINDNKK